MQCQMMLNQRMQILHMFSPERQKKIKLLYKQPDKLEIKSLNMAEAVPHNLRNIYMTFT